MGISVDTVLEAAMALFNREVSGEPIPPDTVENLAKRGVMILGKRELN